MKTIFESVINRGSYDLKGILNKIDTCYIEGKISEEERNYLTDLARNNAQTENSVDVFAKLEELDKRVKALEERDTTAEEEGEEVTNTAPEYVVGKWYYNGDKVTFEGKEYKCIAPEGVVCTWSPSEYPTYWEEVK
ncbi:MAG: hypothetical protein IJZ16_01320 [Clostridia bacterium]|nr:hypothetical protein [Clostridia bacterium]